MKKNIPYQSERKLSGSQPRWVFLLILACILASGAYLRLVGIDWDQNEHLHPDERFLTMVEAAISPIHTRGDQLGAPPTTSNQTWRINYVEIFPDCEEWGGYFDTGCSPLNPNNRGYDFYVYGTLPIFIVRYVAEVLGQTGYGEVYLVGRMLSALADLFVVLLVYAIGVRLYDQRVGILAAAFAAFSVLPIQQSHFFTVDTFTNFFLCLALYFVVHIMKVHPVKMGDISIEPGVDLEAHHFGEPGGQPLLNVDGIRKFVSHPIFLPSILFGVALGMSVASKIHAAPLGITLPGATLVYLFRLSPWERDKQWVHVFITMVLAAFVSLIAFRIFQPYAFTGPGLFGINLNKAWIDDLSSLRAQMGGDVDFPPALQWARRPFWFSLQNQVLWGLGIPLGVSAWVGFLWMGWLIFKGAWKQHAVLWFWTGGYFIWQSLQWNSTMRYQLPIYPLLAIFGAWLFVSLWDQLKKGRSVHLRLGRVLVFVIGGCILVLTLVWAFAFSRIYTRSHTRVAATRWLIQNMPGPVNLIVQTENGESRQPIGFPEDYLLHPGSSYDVRFISLVEGELGSIYLPHVVDQLSTENLSLGFALASPQNGTLLLSGNINSEDIKSSNGFPKVYSLPDSAVLNQGQRYTLTFQIERGYPDFELCGPVVLNLLTQSGNYQQELTILPGCLTREDIPYIFEFPMDVDGVLQALELTINVADYNGKAISKTLTVELLESEGDSLFSGSYTTSEFKLDGNWDENGVNIPVGNEIFISRDQSYLLRFSYEADDGALAISGSVPANESSWDDGLPLRMDGYDPYGGIYPGGFNFEMYWDDNQEKYERFVANLDQADTLLITSSRQWGSTTRVPERYPLTTEYYRRLLGCPAEETVEWCFNVAQPGAFQGELGFELVKVFQSNPSIGSFEINDQFAEEAFTVYDHPKVFIFQKTADYDSNQVREILGAVDLTKVIRITPKQSDSHPGDLMLPEDRLEEQRAGGTWSDYFNPDALQNRYPIVGVLLWYLSISLVGWMVYPLVRFTMPGLSDRGYPFSRITGLLLLSVMVWLSGSARIPFSRSTVGTALFFVLLLGGSLAFKERDSLMGEIRERWTYYLKIEILFLAFFLVGLLVRFGNPDLWHPWKGGEKPMDFSYFNAVLKSTSFPPYDPWFSGGYINYYYYGFVLVGVLVKFLGLVPAFAYNLILPTLFALIGIGAFSIVWNLVARFQLRIAGRTATHLIAGTGALGMAVLGNLGMYQMFARGLQINAAPDGIIDGASFISRLMWTFIGFFKTIGGTSIPVRMDEWYWNPSRVIAYEHGNPITEFPYFSFLYGDLHAHLIALPVALLVVAWVISVVMSRAWKKTDQRDLFQLGLGILVGGLAIGALYPINLSDIYTYLPLGAAALIAGFCWVGDSPHAGSSGLSRKQLSRRLLLAGLSIFALYGLTRLIYSPYIQWYGQGYSDVKIWDGTHTPLSQYLTHWGFFLFVLVSWMYVETIKWMANTPVSALNKLKPYRSLIWVGLVLIGVVMLVLGLNLYPGGYQAGGVPVGLGIHIAWLVVPLVVWTGILILRPNLPDEKRIVLFFIGTGLVLTLVVEMVVVSGDIGRMNTVFKFYLHTWTLFAVSASAAFGWLVVGMRRWHPRWRGSWQLLFGFLLLSTVLYPLLGTTAKIMDRMDDSVPHTLDGMAYMKYATYHDEGVGMDLSQDYNAIRWMQENIEGSPVIVEANSVEYHWGTRFTVYTGLPGVVGWNWHQRQQRTITSHEWVFERVEAVHEFYNTEDLTWTQDFLNKYNVQYIVFGQLEQAKYAGPGLDKFTSQEGILWEEVFRDRDTIIYQVMPSG